MDNNLKNMEDLENLDNMEDTGVLDNMEPPEDEDNSNYAMSILTLVAFAFVLWKIPSIIPFVLTLGIIILIHEWGHFIFAKMSGITVHKFSIGFGPKLAGFKWHGTEYIIALFFFFGGYVKVKGMELDEELEGTKDEYNSRSPFIRFGVVFAGPLMNFVLAVIIFFVVGLIGFQTYPNFVVDISENASVMKDARLVEVNGKATETWWDVEIAMPKQPGPVDVVVESNGKREALTFDYPESFTLSAPMQTVVREVIEGDPADQAGLKNNDVIVALNGLDVVDRQATARSILQANPGVPVEFTVQRGEELLNLTVTPKDEDGIGLIGIMFDNSSGLETISVNMNLSQAVIYGATSTVNWTRDILKGLWSICTGKIKVKDSLGGPITIAVIANDVKEIRGWNYLFEFIAIISIHVAIINLLPIPVFDGGHIFFLFIEMIKGSPVRKTVMEFALKVGLAFILILMVAVFTLDFIRYGSNITDFFKSLAGG